MDAAHAIVIESVVEDKDQKVALLRELDAVMPAGSVIATNTSTLSVSELALAGVETAGDDMSRTLVTNG